MMTVLDLTGAQIVAALQQQVSGRNAEAVKILQVSQGFTYTLDTDEVRRRPRRHRVRCG